VTFQQKPVVEPSAMGIVVDRANLGNGPRRNPPPRRGRVRRRLVGQALSPALSPAR